MNGGDTSGTRNGRGITPDAFSLLNRPALIVLVLVAAAAVGALALRSARGALIGLLLAGAGFGLLVAVAAARFGLPDAGGFFLAGLAGAAAASWAAYRLRVRE